MKINKIDNTNFQAKLVLGKNVRPEGRKEFADAVRSFEIATPFVKGTFYVDRVISEKTGEMTKKLNIYYDEGRYIDFCEFAEDTDFSSVIEKLIKDLSKITSIFSSVTDKDLQDWVKYSFISNLFMRRKNFLDGRFTSTLEGFNRDLSDLSKRCGVVFEDIGSQTRPVRVYPNFKKMENEQDSILGKLAK